MNNYSDQWWKKLASVPVMLIVSLGVMALTVAIFFWTEDKNRASQFGDTFGFAGAVLSGIALIGVAATLRQIEDSQEQQRELINHQEEELKRQQGQIDALAAIARALTDPVVVARVEVSQDTLYFLLVENVGKSPAYDIRFELQPNTKFYPEQPKHSDLSGQDFILNGLHVLAPGEKLATLIGDGGSMRKFREKGIEYVKEFSLSITYAVQPPVSIELEQPSNRKHYHYSFNFDAHMHVTCPPKSNP